MAGAFSRYGVSDYYTTSCKKKDLLLVAFHCVIVECGRLDANLQYMTEACGEQGQAHLYPPTLLLAFDVHVESPQNSDNLSEVYFLNEV